MLLEKILNLAASTTEDQLLDSFETIFQVLRDRDERNNHEKVRREMLVKEKAEYINELCKRGREPGFGEDLSECRIGMVRSWHSRSGVK